MQESIFVVDITEAEIRLDQFLANKTILSRSQVARLIKSGDVLVNNQNSKPAYLVMVDDEISIKYKQAEELSIKPQYINFDIVYEDDDIIVVNKPKHLVVHPGPGNYDHTLVNGLLYHAKHLSSVNGDLRPGIIHRIDKDTSGLLVVAKNDYSHQFIAKQLADKTCFRKYYALLSGVLENDRIIIDAPIGRSLKDRQKMTVTDLNAKNAKTHIEVIRRMADKTFVRVELETGRTHQIRVHCQFIKHPVLNDMKYNTKTIDQSGQILHAYYLSFIHPKTNERVSFETPLPNYFYNYVDDEKLLEV